MNFLSSISLYKSGLFLITSRPLVKKSNSSESLLKSRIVLSVHMWNENELYPNELCHWCIESGELLKFNYHDIIETLGGISESGFPDKKKVIENFKHNYRLSKIETILDN